MNKKGFAPLFILFGIVVIVVLVSGVYIISRRTPDVVLNSPQPTPKKEESCADFDSLATLVEKNIQKPVVDNNFKTMFPDVLEWRRNSDEKFITYPFKKTKNFEDTDFGRFEQGPNNQLKETSKLLNSNIASEAKALGLVPDILNSMPIKGDYTVNPNDPNFTGYGKYLEVFGFKKGQDLYSVILKSEIGYQAIGYFDVSIFCGNPVELYDKFYNALNPKTDVKVINKYENDFVGINEVSKDNKVFGLLSASGSDSQISRPYYLYDGTTVKLLSSDGYPLCSELENLNVGKGISCTDSSDSKSVVDY